MNITAVVNYVLSQGWTMRFANQRNFWASVHFNVLDSGIEFNETSYIEKKPDSDDELAKAVWYAVIRMNNNISNKLKRPNELLAKGNKL